MSADNLGICPICTLEFEKLKNNNPYGKVSEEEYHRYLQVLEDGLDYTLAEYWDIGLDAQGEFEVNYNCECRKCGFTFNKRVSEQVVKGD